MWRFSEIYVMANLKCALASESALLDYIEAAKSFGYKVSSWDQRKEIAILEFFLLLTQTFNTFPETLNMFH